VIAVNELTFRDVTVRFGTRLRGVTAVDRVNLTVPTGEVVGLVGESGSGKSTVARAAVGLAPLACGQILLDGQPLPRTPGRGARRRIQMVFQDPDSSLDPRMTIGASVAEAMPRSRFTSKFGRGRAAQRRAEVARLLELVELGPDRARQYPAQLSGGQRQRVALARALAARPDVIIADEITSALDVSIQGTVLNLVRDIQRRLRLSMLFISHDLAVVRYVSDHIAVMYLGRIVEFGPAEDILRDPQHPYTRQLLASAPQPGGVPVVLSEAEASLDSAEPADPYHPPPGCTFHPRCPVGPLVLPDRDICRTAEPIGDGLRHQAACHFAEPVTFDEDLHTRYPTRSTP
jgi:peptide/nickel transport system ATP-binding protein